MMGMMGQQMICCPFRAQNAQNPLPQRDALGWDMLGFQPVTKSSDRDWAMPYAIATRLSALT
ncbi:hypothetical protein AGMMS49982_14060 [Bacteroidia bacterium]|nr:hypothetical protein AGMMS49982_14060 [Bacteroidia bacterium]